MSYADKSLTSSWGLGHVEHNTSLEATLSPTEPNDRSNEIRHKTFNVFTKAIEKSDESETQPVNRLNLSCI